eukprot:TRINITY_DN6919_c0_g1_i17.p1 TRINITY_DN6919_c0_g1~~TRINITY_DN6919_c0_g1_i17.p1  ORF type:complete len:445 (+),score=79.98 TRINITY_DN6919_c0_g1_i17:100-1434(+)
MNMTARFPQASPVPTSPALRSKSARRRRRREGDKMPWECFITAELMTMYPHNAGYTLWVKEGMGGFFASQESYWQWVSGQVDQAVYPVLIFDSAVKLIGAGELSFRSAWLCKMAITLSLSVHSLAPPRFMSYMLAGCAVLSVVPVVTFVLLGLPDVNWERLQETPEGPIPMKKYMVLLNSIFWNLEGWDCVSTASDFMSDPAKNVPKGLFLSLFIVVGQYLIVLIVATGISQPYAWSEWGDSSLPKVAEDALGPGMGWAMGFATVVSCAGLYDAEFFEDAYQLQGSADKGVGPKIFALRVSWTDAPVAAIALQTIIVMLLCSFDFERILVFDNCFTALAGILQNISFFLLRRQDTAPSRPFSTPAVVVRVLCPIATCIWALVVVQSFAHTWRVSIIILQGLFVGLLYGLWLLHRQSAEVEEPKMVKVGVESELQLAEHHIASQP